MTVNELSPNQFEELRQHYLMEHEEKCEDFLDWEVNEIVREFYSDTEFDVDDFFCSAGEYNREMRVTMTFDENELYAFEKVVGHRIDDEEELYRELRNIIEMQCDIAEMEDR